MFWFVIVLCYFAFDVFVVTVSWVLSRWLLLTGKKYTKDLSVILLVKPMRSRWNVLRRRRRGKQLANLKQDALDNLIDEILIETGGKEDQGVKMRLMTLEQRVKRF